MFKRASLALLQAFFLCGSVSSNILEPFGILLENSMSTRAILSDSAVRVRDDFSVEPDEDAAELEATVLKRLGLERLLER